MWQQALTLAVNQPMEQVNPVSGTQNLNLKVTQMAGRKTLNQPVKVGQPDAKPPEDREQHLRRVQ